MTTPRETAVTALINVPGHLAATHCVLCGSVIFVPDRVCQPCQRDVDMNPASKDRLRVALSEDRSEEA